MSSILKTISLIVFLSLVFVFNECKRRLKQIMIFTNIPLISVESQPLPPELQYWIPQYTNYLQYGINHRFCGLSSKPIEYPEDRNKPNYCSVNEDPTPGYSMDPGDYKRHDHRPYYSDDPKGRIYPPINANPREAPYTLYFRAKIPEYKLRELQAGLHRVGRQANSGYRTEPKGRAPTTARTTPQKPSRCITIEGGEKVNVKVYCTASLIADRWILLAAHCMPYVLSN